MFFPGNYGKPDYRSINEEIAALKGNLSLDEARYWLALFLKENPWWAYSVLTGGENLFPFQVIKIRTCIQRDFVLDVCSRGFAKTFTAAITVILLAIFEPGIKIALLGPSFKQSKGLFKYIEEIAEKPNATLLRAIVKTRKSGDVWEMEIGQSKIFALPLGSSGGKVRGYRCNVLVIDEFLEMPKEIVDAILTPFLVVKRDPENRERITQMEDVAIRKGVLKECDRWVFPNQKLIMLSSAGFKFQYIYQKYQDYMNMITNPSYKNNGISYGLINLSYLIAPESLLDRDLIEKAKKEVSDSVFKREYMGQFADDSSGYFSMAKMETCTVRTGPPYLKLKGDAGKKYIVSIDSNYKDNENSDHFAICVGEILEDGRYAVVHQYAKAGFDLNERTHYLYYLFKNFNVVYIILDDGGAEQLLQYINDSVTFKSDGMSYKEFTANFSKSDDYETILRDARRSYNLTSGNIIHRQFFDANFIVRSNESLQAAFDREKMLFAALPLDSDYDMQIESVRDKVGNIIFDNEKRDDSWAKAVDWLDHQAELIKMTKQECAFIELSATSMGHQSFDLPSSMRKLTGVDRPRKDSYTALLLLNYGFKCYTDMIKSPESKVLTTITPEAF
jgi:hypothetical protein